MIVVCLALIAAAVLISLPLTYLLIGLGRRVGQLDKPDAPGSGGRKDHKIPTPNIGGVAIFAAVVGPLLAGLAAVWMLPGKAEGWANLGFLAPVGKYALGVRAQTPLALALAGALAAVHGLGLVDDRKRLGPFLKLAVQLAAAGMLAGVFNLRVFSMFDSQFGLAGHLASVAITVVWIVVVTNAMNFMDNMDALAGGVGAVVAGLYLAANLIHGQWFVAALAALLLGALLGFLAFNRPPARIFMGDGGSLVLGMLLAVISIQTTYFVPAQGTEAGSLADRSHFYGLLTPLIIMAVPLYDFTSVTLIRLAQGRSPFVGDQSHFSHRLVRKGLTRPVAVLVICLCTLATGLSGVMLASLSWWQAIVAGAQTLAILGVLALLERTKPGA